MLSQKFYASTTCRRLLGKKGSLITFCAVGSPTRRNGIMFVRIRYVPDWVTDWREWPFLGEVFDLEFRDDRF